MAKRMLLAGILGGVGMFVWSSLAHLVLPLGAVGIREIQNETALLGSMRATLGDAAGMYLFPAIGMGANATSAERGAAMRNYEIKLAGNPSGLLLYHPPGAKALTPGQLVTEFATELIEGLLVALLLAQTRLRSFRARVGFVAAIGILAAIATNVSYWNWYGFPGSYTAAYMTIQFVGFLVVGLIAAAVMKAPAAAHSPGA